MSSRPFIILVALLWTHSNSSISLYWGAPKLHTVLKVGLHQRFCEYTPVYTHTHTYIYVRDILQDYTHTHISIHICTPREWSSRATSSNQFTLGNCSCPRRLYYHAWKENCMIMHSHPMSIIGITVPVSWHKIVSSKFRSIWDWLPIKPISSLNSFCPTYPSAWLGKPYCLSLGASFYFSQHDCKTGLPKRKLETLHYNTQPPLSLFPRRLSSLMVLILLFLILSSSLSS